MWLSKGKKRGKISELEINACSSNGYGDLHSERYILETIYIYVYGLLVSGRCLRV